MIGIGSCVEADNFGVGDEPRVNRKKERIRFANDFVLLMDSVSLSNREVPALSEERVRGIEVPGRSDLPQHVSHREAHKMGAPAGS